MAGNWEAKLLDKGLQCPICIEFFNAPLTLSCRHTFCRLCLLQSTRLAPDGRSCPECRATIDIKDPLRHVTDSALEQKIRDIVPSDVLQARIDADAKQLEGIVSKEKCKLPVFYMGGIASKPGQAVVLHFFEPRYKVLIRRTWEGNHRFLCMNRAPRQGDTCLEVQVEQASFQRDGTADIKGIGIKLVTLGNVWVEDGTDGLFYADVQAGIPQAAQEQTRSSGTGDMMPDRRVKETLSEAIREGAPAYNRGQIVICARLYADTAQELLRSHVNSDTEALLLRAVQQAEAAGPDHNKAAWVLRHAFDEILDSQPRSSASSSSSNAHAPAQRPSSGGDNMSERRVKEALSEAIHEGAPAYNRGQVSVCARLYSDTAKELLRSNVNSETAALLQRAVQEAEAAGTDHNKAAWALRHAFDKILDSRQAGAKGKQPGCCSLQ